METWSSNTDSYKLSEEYSITKAIPHEFAIYESVYGDKTYNRFAVKHWDLRLAITLDNPFAENDSFYWIKYGETRVGGVLIEPNTLARLFIIPPFANIFEVIKLLKKLLFKWSDSTRKIYAYQIPEEQYQYFQMLGFSSDKNKRWMMRPTEVFDFNWDADIILKTPTKNKCSEIAKMFYESFNSDIYSNYQDSFDEVTEYFEDCLNKDIFLEASTLIYDKAEETLVAACLISCFEEWPLIYNIAVHPSYRGKNLASTMIKKALTTLNKEYDVLRLFVDLGNSAESVYYDLGFVAGVEFKRFYL